MRLKNLKSVNIQHKKKKTQLWTLFTGAKYLINLDEITSFSKKSERMEILCH